MVAPSTGWLDRCGRASFTYPKHTKEHHMQQRTSSPFRFLAWPALAVALAIAGQAQAQGKAEGSSPPSEVNRGVPGVDVDVNRTPSGGVNVDAQAGNKNDDDKLQKSVQRNTRDMGASGSETTTTRASSGTRKPTQDRN
jgi:hypothetical protein